PGILGTSLFASNMSQPIPGCGDLQQSFDEQTLVTIETTTGATQFEVGVRGAGSDVVQVVIAADGTPTKVPHEDAPATPYCTP
ncbi:MAG: hypothetical protein WCK58_18030, partial [Chloroflexota bacterium]